jgi:hypothetical protein
MLLSCCDSRDPREAANSSQNPHIHFQMSSNINRRVIYASITTSSGGAARFARRPNKIAQRSSGTARSKGREPAATGERQNYYISSMETYFGAIRLRRWRAAFFLSIAEADEFEQLERVGRR